MDTKSLIEALSRPEAYRRDVGKVEVLQTHISVLFFAGQRVYKVKKAVDLGFLDYTTLERRRRFCEEEVRLNRRMSERVHLGVVPIVRDAAGKVRVGGAGETLDWAVEMVRLDAAHMLDALLDAGAVDNAMMDALAELLAEFHGRASTGEGVDEYGAPEAVRSLVLGNLEESERFVASEEEDAEPELAALSHAAHRFLGERARAFLAAEHELLARRVDEGRIRDGHGDLHAGNIHFGAQGIDVYDCIEFSRRFRCADVACDLAFLAMDLDHRGYAGFAGYLVRRYAERAGDEGIARLLRFYKGYRAAVRGKVAALTAADPDLEPPRRRAKRLEAMRYFHLAVAYELPPALVLTCGLPATGKSWLARRLAEPLNAVLLQSDVRRKVLAGVPATARAGEEYGEGLYSPERKEETYRSLLERAREPLQHGRWVVVDATFSKRAWRERFAAEAARLGRPCFVAHVEAPERIVLERLAERARDPQAVSDADAAVYRRAKADFEAPEAEEFAPAALVALRGDAPPEESISRFLDAAVASLAPVKGR